MASNDLFSGNCFEDETPIVKLRQSANSYFIDGWLNKKAVTESSKNGKDYIRAVIEIRTEEDNIISVEMFANKLTKDGRENAIYKGIQTIDKEYVSATEADGGWENATKVKVTKGQITSNDFIPSNDTEVHTATKYSTNFVNRVRDTDTFEPQAKFDLEIIFLRDREETKDGDSTGSGFIDGYFVDYNGSLNPISFLIPSEYWESVHEEFEKFQTLIMHGNIFSKITRATFATSVNYGVSENRPTQNTIKQRVMTGITVVDNDIKIYDKDLILKALAQREKDLQLLKDKNYLSSDDKTTTKATGITNESKSKVVNENELPF